MKYTTPSFQVQIGGDHRSYYSFNRVFGRPAGIGIVGAGGFIGSFILNNIPASEASVIGCTLSRDAAKSNQQAQAVGLRPDQVALTVDQLLEDSRVDVIIVASDNSSHYEISKAALERGKHVICEKPITISVEQATELSTLAKTMGLELGINHFYGQYSLVSTLATLVAQSPADRRITIDPSFLPTTSGLGADPIDVALGELTDVRASYLQDWVLQALREQRRASSNADLPSDLGIWRLDPARQGPSCAYGDIGVHLVELLSHILGDLPTSVSNVKLTKEAEGHRFPLDVRAETTLVFPQGISATTVASQIDQGTLNDVTVELDFEGGRLAWSNRNANVLTFTGSATNGLEVKLERDRPGLQGISADAELLKGVVQGHDQGHNHSQMRLLRLFLDRVCRNNLLMAGIPVVGVPAYSPAAELGIKEMEIVEQVAKG